MLRDGRPTVPAKITSSISPPRSERALVSPIAQRSASTTLDLPQPLGPTMPVRPGRISTLIGSAKLLNPAMRRRRKLTDNGGSFSLRGGDELPERLVAHLTRVFLVVDHEARSRVDAPLFLVVGLLLQDPGAQLRVAIDAAGEGPAVLVGEQRVDERLVALGREVAGDHGGGQRHLVEWEVAI